MAQIMIVLCQKCGVTSVDAIIYSSRRPISISGWTVARRQNRIGQEKMCCKIATEV
jgi:hypothetical protein